MCLIHEGHTEKELDQLVEKFKLDKTVCTRCMKCVSMSAILNLLHLFSRISDRHRVAVLKFLAVFLKICRSSSEQVRWFLK